MVYFLQPKYHAFSHSPIFDEMWCAVLRMLTQTHGLAAEGRMRVLAARCHSQSVGLQAAETARLQALPVHCRIHALLDPVPVASINHCGFSLRCYRVL